MMLKSTSLKWWEGGQGYKYTCMVYVEGFQAIRCMCLTLVIYIASSRGSQRIAGQWPPVHGPYETVHMCLARVQR